MIAAVGGVKRAEGQGFSLDTSGTDSSVRIQDDLFLHVNGTWLKTTEIPADKSNYGSFIQLDDLSRERIRATIERAAAVEAKPGSDEQKIGDFYRSFMDEQAANEKGALPLNDLLASVEGMKTHDDVRMAFARVGVLGVGSPVGLYVGIDEKNSEQYLTNLVQGATLLPDREYYLNRLDSTYDEHRAALVRYVERLVELTGITAEQPGQKVLDLETRLAAIRWSRTESRDANKTYNKHTLDELEARVPSFDWPVFFQLSRIQGVEAVNLAMPSYFERLDQLVGEIPVDTWRLYLQVRIADSFAAYLSHDFVSAQFEFAGKQLAGIEQLEPRWKRAVDAISGGGAGDFGVMGELLGRLYVQEYFKPEAKARMDGLVQNLLKSFGSSIDELAWMTEATRAEARDKLARITTKIGYPEKWRDYSALQIKPDDLLGNIVRSRIVEHHRNVVRLGKPVDRLEWGMTPQTVNAYYNPSMNEIVFPAAILQPPFFDPGAPDALNYGGIGAVIGHEISHAFDDQGSKYDGKGNLRNWWTPEDHAAFSALTERLVAQYDSYQPLDGKNVNGRLTLGENIADLSGLAIAYKAYQLAKNGVEPEPVAGWTGNQLFFVGWSRVWQRKYKDAEMVKRLLTDPHSPSQYRTNGPVMNIDAFFDAFELKPGDGLYKPAEERIRIW
jgi:predicted metalloendopeptidase